MKSVQINLYSFAELSEKAKQFAINEHGDFLESLGNDLEDENGEIYRDYSRPTDADIIEGIEANSYLYFANGEMASITHYCGGHAKAGITEFKFHGEIIDITNF